MLKRMIALLLTLILVLGMVPASMAAESTRTDLEKSIEKQIRAFADSIDQPKADETAAMILATHGITGGGKKLSAGKNHSLTVTILNSEVAQQMLTSVLSQSIQLMQQSDCSYLAYVIGRCDWHGNESGYSAMQSENKEIDFNNYICRILEMMYVSSGRNSYDNSLDWMVGHSEFNCTLERIFVTASEAVYRLNLTLYDRFDFSTASNAGFKKFMSGLGEIMFNEYDWDVTFSLDVTVPYECSHVSGNYHFIYDRDEKSITAQTEDGFLPMEVFAHAEEVDEKIKYRYEFSEPLRLYHDVPWVVEYEVKRDGIIVFAPFWNKSTEYPALICDLDRFVAVQEFKWVMDSGESDTERKMHTAYGYYGLPLKKQIPHSTQTVYNVRLENIVNEDGSNMIVLSLYNEDKGGLLMDKQPLDKMLEYYTWQDTSALNANAEDWTQGNSEISGIDLRFSYLGRADGRFDPDMFEMWVWEYGKDSGNVSLFEDVTVQPTCTSEGYVGKTCSACGYTEKSTILSAIGHSFGAWKATSQATCTEAGKESRKCGTCGFTESREVPALEHDNVETRIEPSCTDEGYVILD